MLTGEDVMDFVWRLQAVSIHEIVRRTGKLSNAVRRCIRSKAMDRCANHDRQSRVRSNYSRRI